MIRLQHHRPDGEIDTYHLKAGRRFHIGRGSHCELRILDLKLSRKHCVVFFDRGIWHVEDLSSTNGCKLNEKPVLGTAALNVGNTLTCGQTSLQVASIDSDESGLTPGPVPSDSIQLNIDEPKEAAPPAVKKPLAQQAKAAGALVHSDDLILDIDTALLPAVKDQPNLEQVEVKETPTAVRSEAELNSNNWLPEPDVDLHTKTDTLQPINKQPPPPARPASFPTPLPIPASAPLLKATPPALPPRKPVAESKPESAKSATPLPLPFEAEAPAPQKPTSPPPAQISAQQAATPKPQPIKPVTIRVGHPANPLESAPNFSDPPSSLANRAVPTPTPATKPAPPTSLTPKPAPAALPTPRPAPAPKPAKLETEKLLKSHPNTDSLERTFFINVLGKRIGPLTRAEARDLKTKELRGTLNEADLKGYPEA